MHVHTWTHICKYSASKKTHCLQLLCQEQHSVLSANFTKKLVCLISVCAGFLMLFCCFCLNWAFEDAGAVCMFVSGTRNLVKD